MKILKSIIFAVCFFLSPVLFADKVNINNADHETLMQLKGIGEKKAADIIAYREEYGAFTTVEEIKNIKGIGEKILTDNAEQLTVQDDTDATDSE